MNKKICLFIGSGASTALAEIATQEKFMKDILLDKERREWISGAGWKPNGTDLCKWIEEIGDIELCMSYLHSVTYDTPAIPKTVKQIRSNNQY